MLALSPLSVIIADQLQALNELGDELQEWYDNSPEGLQNSDKMSVVLEAASVLSYLDEPEIPEWLATLDFQEPHCKQRVKTKADRLAYHCALLRTITETLLSTVHLAEDDTDEQEELDTLTASLDDLINEVEGLLS